MDRPIQKTFWQRHRTALSLGALGLVGLVAWGAAGLLGGRSQTVKAEQLSIAVVEQGKFEEFVAVNGTVEPLQSVVLVALEGGIVEEKIAEDGVELPKGAPILRLSNRDLQLDFMNREAQFLDQMNNLRNTGIALENTHLALQQQLVDAEQNWILAKRTHETNSGLYESAVIAKQEYERTRELFEHARRRYDLLRSAVARDSAFKQNQARQLEFSQELIHRNLEEIRQSLAQLTLRAPIAGRLTGMTAEIGQRIDKGATYGQMAAPGGFKLNALIDEHYIARVTPGLRGEIVFNGKTYRLQVNKVYPQVTNGQFRADLIFADEAPASLSRGQTFTVRISLGEPAPALMVSKGSFFAQTGGNWIYALRGDEAVRKAIRLGRQNPTHYEVLDGLQPGDSVVVSGYESFGEVQTLRITR